MYDTCCLKTSFKYQNKRKLHQMVNKQERQNIHIRKYSRGCATKSQDALTYPTHSNQKHHSCVGLLQKSFDDPNPATEADEMHWHVHLPQKRCSEIFSPIIDPSPDMADCLIQVMHVSSHIILHKTQGKHYAHMDCHIPHS